MGFCMDLGCPWRDFECIIEEECPFVVDTDDEEAKGNER